MRGFNWLVVALEIQATPGRSGATPGFAFDPLPRGARSARQTARCDRATRENRVAMMQLGTMSGSNIRRETEIFTEGRPIDRSKHGRYSAR